MNRDEAISKAKKLMAMATDDRGNEHEAERALAQAEAIMRKFGIEQAEVIAQEAKAGFDWATDFSPYSWTEYRVTRVPDWYQWIATSVAYFTDTIVKIHSKADLGLGVGFYGERGDVAFAVWLQTYLRDVVRKTTEKQRDLDRSQKADFRKAMTTRLCGRLRELRAERDVEFGAAQDSQGRTGTALVVVNNKIAMRDQEFGAQKYGKSKQIKYKSMEATQRGRDAANSVGFHRPLTGASNNARIGA